MYSNGLVHFIGFCSIQRMNRIQTIQIHSFDGRKTKIQLEKFLFREEKKKRRMRISNIEHMVHTLFSNAPFFLIHRILYFRLFTFEPISYIIITQVAALTNHIILFHLMHKNGFSFGCLVKYSFVRSHESFSFIPSNDTHFRFGNYDLKTVI